MNPVDRQSSDLRYQPQQLIDIYCLFSYFGPRFYKIDDSLSNNIPTVFFQLEILLLCGPLHLPFQFIAACINGACGRNKGLYFIQSFYHLTILTNYLIAADQTHLMIL